MRPESKSRIGLLVVVLLGLAALPARAQGPAAGTSEEWIMKLAGLETAPELDITELRQQLSERVKSRTEPVPGKRPPAVPQLLRLPQLVAEIQFDDDAAVVRPESYRVLGRIADTLSHPSLLGYKFLIVGHVPSTGRRDHNLTLSQRRADVVRDVLVNTFKLSSKRLQSIGLGEEQLLDRARPTAPVNAQFHVMTVGKL
ncbi:OmpA family protein [Bradyrhizobium sp.]|uniref:OmpA family protein n=1 Tax=Bradyrhizobium sp. TaxID=376 RepID=UPI000A7A220D|nr:OmpA family protein [Bradyrhizobium sp.]